MSRISSACRRPGDGAVLRRRLGRRRPAYPNGLPQIVAGARVEDVMRATGAGAAYLFILHERGPAAAGARSGEHRGRIAVTRQACILEIEALGR